MRHAVGDMSVARVLSQAPTSLGLTPEGAAALLRRHCGSVSRSVKAARRQAAGDASVMQPVPEPGTDFRNLGHAANSCYVASIITACFAQWDAWDALLSQPPGGDTPPISALRNSLRYIVNTIRTNSAVEDSDVEKFRSALVALGFPGGRRQEDATDLFARMVDWLGAPLLPFGENLLHNATRDEHDERLVAERILWLPVPEGNGKGRFTNLLDAFFFGETREGLRRAMPEREAIVNAWCIRLLLPEYTPSKGLEDRTLRHSFEILAMPFAIKRYNSYREKQRLPIEIPLKVDFTKYVNSNKPGERYALSLKSVVCHIGSRIGAGHYVAYTYDKTAWRRWDDLHVGVVDAEAEGEDGMPANERWREEILRDSYMIFYELLPGDGTGDPSDILDASSSGDIGSMEACRQTELFLNELQQRQDFLMAQRILSGEVGDFLVAQMLQNRFDGDYARNQNNQVSERHERQLREEADLEMAQRLAAQVCHVSDAEQNMVVENPASSHASTGSDSHEEQYHDCQCHKQECDCEQCRPRCTHHG